MNDGNITFLEESCYTQLFRSYMHITVSEGVLVTLIWYSILLLLQLNEVNVGSKCNYLVVRCNFRRLHCSIVFDFVLTFNYSPSSSTATNSFFIVILEIYLIQIKDLKIKKCYYRYLISKLNFFNLRSRRAISVTGIYIIQKTNIQ